MASEQIEIGISLDNAEALAKTLDLGKAIDSLGDTMGVPNLATKFGQLAIVVTAVKKAIDLVNTGLNFALAGENVIAIEKQFSNLADTAGVAGDQIVKSMQKIAKGTIDDTDAMALASKAIVQLGKDSAKIPDIFAVARNAARTFGGTAEEQFERITQAIGRQSTRQLAAIGIHINADETMRRYAQSVGKAVNELTEADKRQAILNETLRIGQKQMDASGGSSKPLSESYKQFQVATGQLKEAIEKLTATMLADSFSGFFKNRAESAKAMTDEIVASTGHGTEAIEAQIRTAERQLSLLEVQRSRYLANAASGVGDFQKAQQEAADSTSQKIQMLKIQLEDLEKARRMMEAPKEGAKGPSTNPEQEAEELRKRQENFVAFERARIAAAQESMNARLNLETNFENADKFYNEQKALRVQQFNLLQQEIRLNTTLREEQKNALLKQSAETLNANLLKLDRDRDDSNKRIIENIKKTNVQGFDGIKLAAQAAFKNITQNSNDMVSVIQPAIEGMVRAGAQAFSMMGQAIGEILAGAGEDAKKAAEKILAYMLGAIADIAIQMGTMFMIQALSPEMSWKAPIGAALLVFGGVLKGVSGVMTKNLNSGSNAGGAGGGSSSSSVMTSQNALTSDQRDRDRDQRERDREERERQKEADKLNKELEKQQREEQRVKEREERERLMAARELEKYTASTKGVSINIQGSYFETEQTKTRLMDLVRQASDGQDYNLVKVGAY